LKRGFYHNILQARASRPFSTVQKSIQQHPRSTARLDSQIFKLKFGGGNLFSPAMTSIIEGNNSVGSLLEPLLKKVTLIVGSRMLCRLLIFRTRLGQSRRPITQVYYPKCIINQGQLTTLLSRHGPHHQTVSSCEKSQDARSRTRWAQHWAANSYISHPATHLVSSIQVLSKPSTAAYLSCHLCIPASFTTSQHSSF
jgi:hypothetical protein